MASLETTPRRDDMNSTLQRSKFLPEREAETDRIRITQESVNFSQANRQYTFGHGDRFRSTIKVTTDRIGYDLPSTLGRRTCSFGIGPRFQTPDTIRMIRQAESSPPPGSYQLISDFDVGNKKLTNTTKAGLYSFGIGHKHYRKVYIPGQKISVAHPDAVPGPGHYNPAINTVGHEPQGALTTKFQGRSNNVQEPAAIMQKQNVPGPGHYGDPMCTAATGNYVLSTIPNAKHGRISPTKRFTGEQMSGGRAQLPGPGTYDPTDYINGEYIVSNFRSKATKILRPQTEQGYRAKMSKPEAVPGPGTYKLPSDFGYLELKKWHVSNNTRNAANSSLEGQRATMMVGSPYQQEMNRFMMRRKSQQSSQLQQRSIDARRVAKSSQGHSRMRNRTITHETPQKFAGNSGTRTSTRGQTDSQVDQTGNIFFAQRGNSRQRNMPQTADRKFRVKKPLELAQMKQASVGNARAHVYNQNNTIDYGQLSGTPETNFRGPKSGAGQITMGSTQQIEHDSGMGTITSDMIAINKGSAVRDNEQRNAPTAILQEPTMN